MLKGFKSVEVRDNFFESSAFFPMPLVMVGTLVEDQSFTSFGSYSLVFPYYIAGKDHYCMILECRNTSNTAKGLLRHGKCTLNFLPGNKFTFNEAIKCGFPGDLPEDKMKNFKLTLKDGLMAEEHKEEKYPKVIEESLQVFECSWWKELDNAQDDPILDDYEGFKYHNFNGITSQFGAHFILKIDRILLKDKYAEAVINGTTNKNFCPLPTIYGFRDSKNFWCSKHKRPTKHEIGSRKIDLSSVRFAVNTANTKVNFTDDALEVLTSVPRVFLKLVIKNVSEWAIAHNLDTITAKEMAEINAERKSKNKKK